MFDRQLTRIAPRAGRTLTCLNLLLFVQLVLVVPGAKASPVIYQSATSQAGTGNAEVGLTNPLSEAGTLGVRFEV